MDNADQILQALTSESAEPRAEFKHGLRNQVIEAANQQNPASLTFIDTIMNSFRKKGLLIGGGFFSVAIVSVVALALVFNNRAILPVDKSAEEIFAAIQQSQSNNLSEESSRLSSAATSATPAMGDLAILPYFEPNHYSYYVSASEAGPAADRCEGMVYFHGGFVQSESYNFSDAEANYYGKHITKDRSGTILNYNLSLPDTRYEYNGGSYAVKSPNNLYTLAARSGVTSSTGSGMTAESAPDGAVSDEPVAVEPDVLPTEPEILPTEPAEIREPGSFDVVDYFGDDAAVLGQEQIGDQTYYIASWSYNSSCGKSDSEVKIYNKVWINLEDYDIAKEEQYLGSISDENLIVFTTSNREERKAELSEVSQNFNFDLQVRVVEIDPAETEPGSEQYNTALLDMLAARGLQLITPSGFELQGIYSSRLDLPDPYAYQYDRDFYPAGEAGDKMFAEVNQWRDTDQSNNPYLTASFGNQDRYVSLDAYAQNSQTEYGLDFANASAAVLNVGGQQITAEWLSNPYRRLEEPTDLSAEPGVEYEVPTTFVARFNFSGHTYLLWLNNFADENQAKQVAFTALSASSSRAQIQNLIENIQFASPELAL